MRVLLKALLSYPFTIVEDGNAVCPVCIGPTECKIRLFKILDIYALVHYTYMYISNIPGQSTAILDSTNSQGLTLC